MTGLCRAGMIRKTAQPLSEKIMPNERANDDPTKSHRALD
jgi:hypothetical protein